MSVVDVPVVARGLNCEGGLQWVNGGYFVFACVHLEAIPCRTHTHTSTRRFAFGIWCLGRPCFFFRICRFMTSPVFPIMLD